MNSFKVVSNLQVIGGLRKDVSDLTTALRECVALLERNNRHHGETATWTWTGDQGTNWAAWLISENDLFITHARKLLERK